MAGIGFELKKLFAKKGVFSLLRAYGYAGIVCSGPMILGMVLLLGIHVVAQLSGLAEHELQLLNSMITYSLITSLLVTNVLSMVTTRYVSDMLYEENDICVMPSFYGSIGVMEIFGGLLYGFFLCFSGVDNVYKAYCLVLFLQLVVVWTEINYLTAVKDYRGIIRTFFISVTATLLLGILLTKLMSDIILAMLLALIMGYGFMMAYFYKLLLEYFPDEKEGALDFLKWIDKYPQLVVVGTCLGLGLFTHLVIMWFSPAGTQIEGMFFGAPIYDIPALVAFLSILSTTITFVTMVEVNFYPKYRIYYGLFNQGGSIIDIEKAEEEMLNTYEKEMSYSFTKQFFVTVIFVVGGTVLLPNLPLGFTDDMLGIYRVLCIGYAFYAAANSTMLMALYFADNEGAMLSSVLFAVVSISGTILSAFFDSRYYGWGFAIGSVVFCAAALLRMMIFKSNLSYHVICEQPIVEKQKRGFFTAVSEGWSEKYDAKRK